MSSKGGSNATTGYRYMMSLLMGVCRGPIDILRVVRAGDRTAFSSDATGTGTYSINQPDLFGGDKSEGGLVGDLTVMMGDLTQVVSSDIKTSIGGLQPDFRGVLTLWYKGQISANNPYPKEWKFRVARALKGWTNDTPWYPAAAVIILPGDDEPTNLIYAMNPAHILYECATNAEWGRAWPASYLDLDSFQAAATTLYNEGFGLCLKYNRQDGLSDFVSSVISHIGGAMYFDRKTSLLTLKLIRDDYVTADLPVFDFNSGVLDITDDTASAPSANINEIIVSYTNPVKNEPGSTRVQALGSIQSNGVISQTNTYDGIPVKPLASRVAQRDLRTFAFGLKRYTIKMDRRAWELSPADVFVLHAPERKVDTIVVRVAEIEDALFVDGTITLKVVQDVFGLPATTFVGSEPTTWVPPDRTPAPPPFTDVHEASYRDLARILTGSELATLLPESGALATLAQRPTSLSMNYRLWSKVGSEAYAQRTVEDWVPSAQLVANVGVFDTSFTIKNRKDLTAATVAPGMAIKIGTEILKLVTLVGNTLTVLRGCVDTIPQAHATNDSVWIYDQYLGNDGREYVSGQTVDAKLVTHTSAGDYSFALTPVNSVIMARRQYRPYPPGKVLVGATRFAEVTSVVGDVAVTWTYRDRVVQDDSLVDHSAGSIGPEPGTTYNIRVYTGVTLLRTVTGIVVNNWTYDYALAEADGWADPIRLELESQRATFTSAQKYSFGFNHTPGVPRRPVITTISQEVGAKNPFLQGTSSALDGSVFIDVYVDNVFNVTTTSTGTWGVSLTGLALGARVVKVLARNGLGSSPYNFTPITLTVVWYNPQAAIVLDFENNRSRVNGTITLGMSDADWSTVFNTVLTSPAQIFRKANGDLMYLAANKLPRVPNEGAHTWHARTNRNTNWNAAPVLGVPVNVTKTGDVAATLAITADTAALTSGKFADATLTAAMNGNCLDLDNTLGVADARAVLGGTVGVTTACTFSIYVRGDAGRIETNNASPAILASFAASAVYQRVEVVFTPAAVGDQVQIVAPATKRVRATMNTLEQASPASDPIIIAGASATRAVASLRRTPGADYNATEGFMTVVATQVSGYQNSGVILQTLQADANNGNFIQMGSNTTVRGVTQVAASQVGAPAAAAYTDGSTFRAVFGYKANDFAFSKDGATASVDTSGAVATGTPILVVLGNSTGTVMFDGTIKRIEIGTTKPTTADLERMAGWILP